MKATILQKHGGSEVLEYVENFPEPELKPDEVLVKIFYTSLNRVDLHIRRGYPGLNLQFPHIIGADIAGEVVAIGTNVKDIGIGEKVVAYPIVLPKSLNPKFEGMEHLNDGWKYYGMHIWGSYAQFVSVPANNVVKLVEGVDYKDACTLPVAGLTAYHAVVTVGAINEGDVFFFWGGSSGLGAFAIQLAKMKGATVVTTVGSNEKKQLVSSIGADFVYNRHEDDVVNEVLKIYPNGVDVVLDFVGSGTFDKSLSLLRKNGKLLVCGMLTAPEVTLNLQKFYIRHLNLCGLYLGSMNEFRELVGLYNQGKIKVIIDKVFELKQASSAHEYMESNKQTGKILLAIE